MVEAVAMVRSSSQYGNVESYHVSTHALVSPAKRSKFVADLKDAKALLNELG